MHIKCVYYVYKMSFKRKSMYLYILLILCESEIKNYQVLLTICFFDVTNCISQVTNEVG